VRCYHAGWVILPTQKAVRNSLSRKALSSGRNKIRTWDLVLISQSWGDARNAVFLGDYGYFSPKSDYCKSAHTVALNRTKTR